MTINHIDQLAEWWCEAERGPISPGDTLIQHHPSDDTEYTVYVATEASTDSGNFVRILARARLVTPWEAACPPLRTRLFILAALFVTTALTVWVAG